MLMFSMHPRFSFQHQSDPFIYDVTLYDASSLCNVPHGNLFAFDTFCLVVMFIAEHYIYRDRFALLAEYGRFTAFE